MSLYKIGGPYVLSLYVFPNQTYSATAVVINFVFAIMYFVSSVYELVYGGDWAYGSAIFFAFLLFLHFYYGKSGEENSEPATFTKYLVAPFYVSMILWCAFFLFGFVDLGSLLFLANFVYAIVVLVWLIYADKPYDKTKREIVAEDGTTTKHVIQNDGYYFAVLIFMLISTGIILGIVLGIFKAGGPVAQSAGLQFMSILLLVASQVVSQRSTDIGKFAPLMLIIYFQVDFFQASLFLTTDFFGASCWI